MEARSKRASKRAREEGKGEGVGQPEDEAICVRKDVGQEDLEVDDLVVQLENVAVLSVKEDAALELEQDTEAALIEDLVEEGEGDDEEEVASGEAEDQKRIKKKKPRQKETKKQTKKFNSLYFYPTLALETPSGVSTSGRNLKKTGFIVYNRLTCGACKKTFHKANGLSTHSCPGKRAGIP